MNNEQLVRMRDGQGFIAALDQSGGSTPKALKLYGIEESEYSGDEQMFDLIHQMRTRMMTSPAFTGTGFLVRSCSKEPWIATLREWVRLNICGHKKRSSHF